MKKSNAKKTGQKKVGRPPINPDDRVHAMSTGLSSGDKHLVEELAKHHGITVAAQLRKMVRQCLGKA